MPNFINGNQLIIYLYMTTIVQSAMDRQSIHYEEMVLFVSFYGRIFHAYR